MQENEKLAARVALVNAANSVRNTHKSLVLTYFSYFTYLYTYLSVSYHLLLVIVIQKFICSLNCCFCQSLHVCS